MKLDGINEASELTTYMPQKDGWHVQIDVNKVTGKVISMIYSCGDHKTTYADGTNMLFVANLTSPTPQEIIEELVKKAINA